MDVIQELQLLPAYSKYFLNIDSTDVTDYRPFSLMISNRQDCGITEIDYLARCADKDTRIPQSVLQGAIYLRGGG